MKLASTDSRSENVRVLPIIIAELEPGDIEWLNILQPYTIKLQRR